MTTTATPIPHAHISEATLFVAFELSEKDWKLGFATGHGQKPRERSIPARDQERVLNEIAQAKCRLDLPDIEGPRDDKRPLCPCQDTRSFCPSPLD